MSQVIHANETSEPTLSALLTHYARTAVPAQLYLMLHLGIPVALEFGFRGWTRSAALGVALASLGAWGLADRWVFAHAEARGLGARFVRWARAATGALAAAIPAILLIRLFLHVLGNAPIS
jgi:hypothetical protein